MTILYNIFLLVTALSLLIGIAAMCQLGRFVYEDYKNRKEARARYLKDDPKAYEDEDYLFEHYYQPTITIGELIKGILMFCLPYINVVVYLSLLLMRLYWYLKDIWHRPLIGW